MFHLNDTIERDGKTFKVKENVDVASVSLRFINPATGADISWELKKGKSKLVDALAEILYLGQPISVFPVETETSKYRGTIKPVFPWPITPTFAVSFFDTNFPFGSHLSTEFTFSFLKDELEALRQLLYPQS